MTRRRSHTFTEAEKAQVVAWRANRVGWARIAKTLRISEEKLCREFEPGYAERRDEASRIRRNGSDYRDQRRAEKARQEREAKRAAEAAAVEPARTPSAEIMRLYSRRVPLTGIAALVRQPYRVVSEVIEQHRGAAQ